jgi:hypothetical protein
MIGGWEESTVQRFANSSKSASSLIKWSPITVPSWSLTFTKFFIGDKLVGYNNTESAALDLGFKNI